LCFCETRFLMCVEVNGEKNKSPTPKASPPHDHGKHMNMIFCAPSHTMAVISLIDLSQIVTETRQYQ